MSAFFGSGEFLEDLYVRYPMSTITGVEKNEMLFQSTTRPNVFCMDFLQYTGVHDLIVGNPPYFVMKKTNETEASQSGRPNMFVQFLYKALTTNLTDNGIIAFVLPTSFYNCSYYEKTRRWMYENTTILAMERLNGEYMDTQQETFLLVVKKEPSNHHPFFFLFGGHVYVTPLYRELTQLTQGSTSLAELGFEVKTGDIVWNQVKDKLSDSGTLLIYSSNFSTGTLVLNNLKPPKKQCIQNIAKHPISGKSILINRGYGNTTYSLKSVIVDLPSYFCENHVNVIRPKTVEAARSITDVLKSLQNPKTTEFIRAFIGNGALSKTELESCVPIWLD